MNQDNKSNKSIENIDTGHIEAYIKRICISIPKHDVTKEAVFRIIDQKGKKSSSGILNRLQIFISHNVRFVAAIGVVCLVIVGFAGQSTYTVKNILVDEVVNDVFKGSDFDIENQLALMDQYSSIYTEEDLAFEQMIMSLE